MGDEWRVSVSLPKRSAAKERLSWAAAVASLRSRLDGQTGFSQHSSHVFLYSASARDAAQAERAVHEVLTEHGVRAAVRCDQVNPIRESWTAHEDLMQDEREKSAATGRAVWQVRVDPPSHHELKALARRLEAGGLSVARQWSYLIAGAGCEDEAHALARQIREHSSASTRVRVQPGVYDLPPPVRVWVPSGPGWIWI